MGITVKNNKQVTKNMTIKGDDGVGIKTIESGTPVITEEKTTTPITVTLTDETTQNFNVEAQNGSGGDNVLTKPTTPPSTTQIVAVDNTNTQTMISIGDGLEITNGELSVIENQLFMHSITIDIYESDTSVKRGSVTFHLLTNSTAKYDNIQSIISVLDTYGETNCGGSFSYASNSFGIPYVVYKHNNSLAVRLQEYSFDFANSTININNHIGEDYVLTGNFTVYDTVHQLS